MPDLDPVLPLSRAERTAIAAAKEEALRAVTAELEDEGAPPPATGRFARFFKLSKLSTAVSASYAASKVRRLFQSAPAAAQALDAVNFKNAARIAATLGDLKGAVMKLGQVLSIQEEAVPKEFRSLLSKLQTQAPPMHPTFAIEIIEAELAGKLPALFRDFERKPFAAASLGQVHRATLPSGERVVVKVQYPGIEDSIVADLKLAKPLVRGLALAGKSMDLREAFEEVEARLEEEVDYVHEAENQEAIRDGFARLGRRDIVVPRVFRSHSTRRVLTMERLEGLHLDPFCAAVTDPAARRRARETLSHAIWTMEVELGMLHADPHPGNFLFLGETGEDGRFAFEGRVGLLDFGCVKIFPESFLRSYVRLIRTILAGDDAAMIEQYVKMGFLTEEERESERAREWVAWSYLSLGPLREDRVFPARGESWEKFIAELHEGMQRVIWRVGAYTPRDAVYLNRVTFGVMCFWARLGGASNWHRIMMEHLEAAERRLGLAATLTDDPRNERRRS